MLLTPVIVSAVNRGDWSREEKISLMSAVLCQYDGSNDPLCTKAFSKKSISWVIVQNQVQVKMSFNKK